jgi:hypothetical protein
MQILRWQERRSYDVMCSCHIKIIAKDLERRGQRRGGRQWWEEEDVGALISYFHMPSFAFV